jgi:hypothetical protein
MTQDIERVIVPLDPASETDTAIDTAARLAARWRVPLHAVFIEDEELIGLAGLPFARQVTLGAGLEPLTKDQVEGHFRAFAERTRRELAAAADRHGIKWSFEIMRGPFTPGMLGGEHDFAVAGAVSRPIGDHFRITARSWSWMAVVARPFLLAKRQWETGGSVFALLRGQDPKSARALEVASQIASFHGSTLTVSARPSLADRSLSLQTEPVATEPAALRRRIIELDCRLLVLEAGEWDSQPDELRELVEQLTCDVLIIR